MLIYANKRENDGVNLFFFSSKEAYPILKQLKQITVKKKKKNPQAEVIKCLKKCWVPRNPTPHPLVT